MYRVTLTEHMLSQEIASVSVRDISPQPACNEAMQVWDGNKH